MPELHKEVGPNGVLIIVSDPRPCASSAQRRQRSLRRQHGGRGCCMEERRHVASGRWKEDEAKEGGAEERGEPAFVMLLALSLCLSVSVCRCVSLCVWLSLQGGGWVSSLSARRSSCCCRAVELKTAGKQSMKATLMSVNSSRWRIMSRERGESH
eukprot:3254225-Rhodomonas_salina.1